MYKTIFVAVLFPACTWAISSGPDARNTGAPGDTQTACATAGCHASATSNAPLNFYGGSVTATFSDGGNYTPGKAVTITSVAAKLYYSRPGVVFIPIEDAQPCDVALIWRGDRASSLIGDFIAAARVVRDELQDLPAPRG